MNSKNFAFPSRKISEAFLEFSSPLLKTLTGTPTERDIDKILRITYTIWNAVVLDEVSVNTRFVSEIRESFKHDKEGSSLIEYLIIRKNELFAEDLRIIGEYRIIMDGRKWRLRADARNSAMEQDKYEER